MNKYKFSILVFLWSVFGWVSANPLEEGWISIKGEQVEIPAPPQAPPAGAAPLSAPASTYTQIDDPALDELAKGLENDPALIFAWVYNNVRYVPYFGNMKWAYRTYLDRSGNDFDQASLLISLLTKAGYNDAKYIYGRISNIPRHDMANWFGVADDFDLVVDVLNNGGIPYTYNQAKTEISLMRIWVRVTVGGNQYDIDPAFKSVTRHTPVDPASLFTYQRNPWLDSVLLGSHRYLVEGSGINADTLQWNTLGKVALFKPTSQASVTAVKTSLNNLTSEARTTLGNQHKFATFAEITGDTSLNKMAYTKGASLQSFTYGTQVYHQFDYNSTTYDNTFAHKLVFTVSGATESIPTYALGGRILKFDFNGSQSTYFLDDQQLFSGVVSNVVIDHPYTANSGSYSDQDVTPTPVTSGMYVLKFVGGNPVGNGAIKLREKWLAEAFGDTNEPEQTGQIVALDLLGERHVQQQHTLTSINCNLHKSDATLHHWVGILGPGSSGSILDINGIVYTEQYNVTGGNNDLSGVDASWGMNSILESTIFKQHFNDSDEQVSTVSVIENALNNAEEIMLYTEATRQAVGVEINSNSGSPPYTPAQRSTFSTIALNGGVVLLPLKASQQIEDWSGIAYISWPNGLNSGGGYWISGAYQGGQTSRNRKVFHRTEELFTLEQLLANSELWGYDPMAKFQNLSAEPVDLGTGYYVAHSTDLTLSGDGPKGLEFKRSYNSGAVGNKGRLGHGWTHNWESSLLRHSYGVTDLRNASPEALAHVIVGLHMLYDLYAQGVNFLSPPGAANPTSTRHMKGLIARVVIEKWFGDSLAKDVVHVGLGHQRLTFRALPDGSFVSAPNTTTTLATIPTGYRLTDKTGDTYDFDNNGKWTSWSDVHSNTLTLNYQSDKLTSVTDAVGRTLTFTYTGDLISSVSDSTGRSVSYGYDANNDAILYTDPDGHQHDYIYDALHRMTSLRNGEDEVLAVNRYNALGQVVEQDSEGTHTWKFFYSGSRNVEQNPQGGQRVYYYNDKGLIVGLEDELGQMTVREYNGQNKLTAQIEPSGKRSEYEYDNNLNLVKARTFLNGQPVERLFAYDALGRMTSETDPLGNQTTHGHDALHNQIWSENAKGERVTREFYANGNVKSVKDPANNKTSYEYDSFGGLSKVTYPDGNTEVYTNNARGDRLTAVDRLGNTTTVTYNNKRHPLTVTDPQNKTESYVYKSSGYRTSVTDRNGNTTSYVWSALGSLKSITNALGKTTTYADDSRGWHTNFTTPKGNQIVHNYDNAGRETSKTDQNGQTMTFVYDADGEVVSVKNQLNDTITNAHDSLGRLTTISNGLQESVGFTYDDAGNMLSVTDPGGGITAIQYDELNRMKLMTSPLGRQFSVTYNNRGLMTSRKEPSLQETTIVYDNMARMSSSQDPDGTKTYTYDADGNQLTVSESGSTITREIDSLDRITKYVNADGDILLYQYDAIGNLTKITYPDGKEVSYVYDALNRLTSVTDWASRITTFEYDDENRMTKLTRHNGTYRELEYNAVGRVTKIQEKNSQGNLICLYVQQFDDAGKITKQWRLPRAKVVSIPQVTNTFDTENKLTAVNGVAVSFDQDGNMVSGPLDGANSVAYTYNARNLLLSVSGHSYQYDPENRLSQITNAGNVTKLVTNPHSRLPQVLVTDPSSGTKRYYVHALGLLYDVDTAGNPRYYHYDYAGNTMAITDQSGAVITRFDYSPYGLTTHQEGDTDTLFRYNGRYGVLTDASGLLHMRARFYNPNLRRFLNSDPAGFLGGFNFFAYADGNPISNIDPFGFGAEEADGYTALDGVQDTLSVGGLWPGVGILPDGANTVISLFRGRWADAGVNAVAMIPAFGQLATGSKYLSKADDVAIRASDDIVEIAARVSGDPIRFADKTIRPSMRSMARELGVDSGKARTHLRKALNSQSDAVAHHLIPWKFRDHPLVEKAASGGFNINGFENGVNITVSSGRHKGPHLRYNDAIETVLDSVHRNYPDMTSRQAQVVLSNYASMLKNGFNRSKAKLVNKR